MTDYREDDWIETYTGRRFSVMNPTPDQVCINDIGHALAHLCRFNGHCKKFYSVAQHSILVSQWCLPENQWWALLHDASEAYLCDIPRPIKQFLPEYKKLEEKYQRVIAEAFDLSWPMPDEVKELDSMILRVEHRDVMNYQGNEWAVDSQPLLEMKIGDLWPPDVAEELFLYTFMGE
jgi:hypothetical protein